MTSSAVPDAGTETAAQRRGRLRLTRGITATWWYTVSAVVFLELMIVGVWAAALTEAGRGLPTVAAVGLGGLVWWAATFLLLHEYRRRNEDEPFAHGPRILVPLLIAACFGVLAGVVSGLWLMAVLPIVQALVLINWPPGIRLRVVIAATALLAVLWYVDSRLGVPGEGSSWWLLGFFSVSLPGLTVLSLWWWDVLMTVNSARASEARLAATQERLRVATDVHDLQGHHLQVIALQLELAERLMADDPDAAFTHLRAARKSVDDARQGTRDLALRFRSVPLTDEIENAADLLRAAGTSVQVSVDAGADRAPASVLGPVIRETTTNVLRHGGGRWARLSLTREPDGWRYEIENDAVESSPSPDGAGLEGIGRRVADGGGTVEVRRDAPVFAVVVRVPLTLESS
ncbi:sensor histidine kinase [Microbacterium sp. CFH 90308]|uniref:Sensor histidine kinase n=1 Tax=Microbacterium salsuginis TaxID=2722803 RepID=A0ABX1KG88_9MICO|nr:histidine kinase [Microbacterium sp. CFH 90308]NLP86086.1 sensor histidine kinase [Microbacterium sp. CFH 90308]